MVEPIQIMSLESRPLGRAWGSFISKGKTCYLWTSSNPTLLTADQTMCQRAVTWRPSFPEATTTHPNPSRVYNGLNLWLAPRRDDLRINTWAK